MTTTLQKIEAAFADTFEEFGEPVARSLEETMMIASDLEVWGFAIIKDPITAQHWNNYYQLIACELAEHLFQLSDPLQSAEFKTEFDLVQAKFPHDPHGIQMLRAFGKWWNASNGFGNCNFRFLYFQYQANPPVFEVGNEEITFCRNPFHRWNIRLLASEPKLWELLKSFHPPGKAMVSWDSSKLRINHPKATKAALTVRHRDVYNYDGKPVDRKQAMLINQDPGAISLGWVMFSHLPHIQKLLAEYFGKKPNQFSTVEDPSLNAIIDKYWRSISGGFVIWEQFTIHYEAQPTKSLNGISQFKSFTQPACTNNLVSVRVVIGSHQPQELSQSELKQLAFLSEHGHCPAVYNNPNKGTAVAINTVNKKSTQWKQTRKPGKLEIKELNAAKEGYDENPKLRLKSIYKEMYGLY